METDVKRRSYPDRYPKATASPAGKRYLHDRVGENGAAGED